MGFVKNHKEDYSQKENLRVKDLEVGAVFYVGLMESILYVKLPDYKFKRLEGPNEERDNWRYMYKLYPTVIDVESGIIQTGIGTGKIYPDYCVYPQYLESAKEQMIKALEY